jgi:hypothetical protein
MGPIIKIMLHKTSSCRAYGVAIPGIAGTLMFTCDERRTGISVSGGVFGYEVGVDLVKWELPSASNQAKRSTATKEVDR